MSSYHFLQGPLVAVLALGVIVLICRWVFSTGHRDAPVQPAAAEAVRPADYGLLRPVCRAAPEQAAVVRARLTAAGIRATTGPAADSAVEVLVFPDDLVRARTLIEH